jgi:3-oxoadipate enol-lactonase
VLVGEHDQLTPPYLSQELAELLPNATLKVLAGAHSGFVEYPALYAQTVSEILRKA